MSDEGSTTSLMVDPEGVDVVGMLLDCEDEDEREEDDASPMAFHCSRESEIVTWTWSDGGEEAEEGEWVSAARPGEDMVGVTGMLLVPPLFV